MILEIDNREPLIIKSFFEKCTINCNIVFKNLELGDYIIKDSNENIILIFERKSINDLLSSIKDNRYQEQSDRLSQLDISSKKIYYLIEGNVKEYNKESSEYKSIYSCIYSLSYKKEFSVLLTSEITDTIIIIFEFLKRIIENKVSTESKTSLIKKNLITKENIDYYMLNLVPGVGLQTAKELLNSVEKSFYEFYKSLKNSDLDLDNIKIKNRKLSKKVIKNIKDYLL